MDILLLGIYAFFVWLIFFKFKWLPWNITSQVIVITIPIIALTTLILVLNVVAPSSHDVRVVNYYVQIVPRVAGRVVAVPVEPNRHINRLPALGLGEGSQEILGDGAKNLAMGHCINRFMNTNW